MAGLPKAPPRHLTYGQIERFIAVDKKNTARGLVWALPVGPGAAELVRELPSVLLRDTFKALRGR